jgi:hypothetical protein
MEVTAPLFERPISQSVGSCAPTSFIIVIVPPYTGVLEETVVVVVTVDALVVDVEVAVFFEQEVCTKDRVKALTKRTLIPNTAQ